MNIFTISQSKRNDQIISQFFFFLYLFQNSARFKSNIILPICNNFFATYHFYNNLPTISFQMFNLFDLERSSIKDKSINFTTMLTKLPNIITLTLFTFRPVKTRKKEKDNYSKSSIIHLGHLFHTVERIDIAHLFSFFPRRPRERAEFQQRRPRDFVSPM